MNSAQFGELTVTGEEVVFADAEGVLFAPIQQAEAILSTVHNIWQKERRQAREDQSWQKAARAAQFRRVPGSTFR